jgi:large subunit ribosomal protein L6
MSRIGKKTIEIPNGVTVEIKDGLLLVKGPKGQLARPLNSLVTVKIADNTVTVSVANEEEKKERSLWGTWSAHIQNMVTGVTAGFKKQLEINGVGYKVAMQGTDLKLEVGFSHPVIYKMPKDVKATVDKNIITLEGADVELLGATAAEVRAVRKPEPYKGKGIRYVGEVVRHKEGKTAAAAK